ncbi:GNAT family N-acetyltransferase [Rhizobium puerariae]|uniref:GNAT family N-acetyltransferase n=1 Tax=Rhizobium puerariae TaxID=1585791 RepID=A0ABV6AC71_9HYPH
MRIRDERPGDEDTIHELTQTAFAPMPYSVGTEGSIIRALRRSGDLSLSLVAEDDGNIVGHAAFSPVAIDGVHDGWFGLGPISVRADRQRQGIGKALIREGLERLKARGAKGCALVGNLDVYRSSGFENDGRLSCKGVDDRYVQRLGRSDELTI